ncbi:MAG TPA: mandelate racemase/muconate lactonizing enzyme family protein [Xanthobacteraceae bacterium]|nr:mandelate racemase/muconate lactonizing enzyme family protein [Xanthobacteraceae bacterium]
MKIAKLEDFHADGGWRTFSFLKLTTDEGLVGWAEYAEGFGAGGVTQIIRNFAPIVQGMDPRQVGKITASLQSTTRLAAGGLNHQAIAAIENACLDVKAKAAGVPVCALFGGPFRDRLPLYWSHCGSFRAWRPDYFEKELGFSPIRSLDDLTALAKDAVARGFKAVKTNPMTFGAKHRPFNSGFRITPGFLDRHYTNEMLDEMGDVLGAFRDGLGPHAGLMFDINFALRTEGFLRVAKMAEPYKLTWFEIDMHDPEALALVRRSTTTPITSLESLHGTRAYRPYFQNYAVDVSVVDVPWNGLWESVRIATLADAYEVDCAPHNFYGHLATMMSAHFCAAIPNFRIMEIEVDDVPWKDDLVTVAPVIENGELLVPTTPGWGCDVNEEALKAHPAKIKI